MTVCYEGANVCTVHLYNYIQPQVKALSATQVLFVFPFEYRASVGYMRVELCPAELNVPLA